MFELWCKTQKKINTKPENTGKRKQPSVAVSHLLLRPTGLTQITLTGKETNQIKVLHWMKEASQVSWQGYGGGTTGTGITHGLFYYWRGQNSSSAAPVLLFTRRSGARTGTCPHPGQWESNP